MNGFFNRKVTFDISYATFAKMVIIALLLLFLYLVREVILLMFVAIVIASGIDPWIDFLQRHGIPRWLSTILIFVLLVGVIFLTIYLLIPPITSQFHQLIQYLPQYFNILFQQIKGGNVSEFEVGVESIQKILSNFTGKGEGLVGNLFSTFSGVISGLVSAIVVFVLAFYFVVEEDNFKKFIRSITPAPHRPYVENLVDRLQIQIGRWFRGQLLLGLIVGVMVFVGLAVAGVKYALVLALLAGILELVPYIGPIISAVPAVFLGFVQSPVLGLVVAGIYVLVQQLENHFIVPNVMKKVVGLNPLVIILVILVGGKVAGVLGALLAVPLATALHVFIADILESSDQKKEKRLQHEPKLHEVGLTEKELKQYKKQEDNVS